VLIHLRLKTTKNELLGDTKNGLIGPQITA
jgi:hypothetical protein